MKIDFGKELVSCDDGLNQWLSHFKHNMSPEERKDRFAEARRDGTSYFSPKPGVHLVLRRNPDGKYNLDKA